jgi:hypothetical protein
MLSQKQTFRLRFGQALFRDEKIITYKILD